MSPLDLVQRALDSIERAGNKLPHPALLFIWLSLFVVALSWLLSAFNVDAIHPVTQQSYQVANLVNAEGLQRILGNAVSNFTQFAPVGVVLVVMMGIGVAEHSGLVACLLKRLVRRTSHSMLAYVTAFAGVMSSIGADVGYVVLIPIAALMYRAFDRPALAGIAVAFAGVSAGFSANLVLGPVDVILAGISTEAVQLVDASAEVKASDNYYFIVASTLLITFVCGWLSNRVIEPRISQNKDLSGEKVDSPKNNTNTTSDNRSLQSTGWFSLFYLALMLLLSIPDNAPLGSGSTGSSLLLKNIVPLLAIYFALAGYIFGRSNKVYTSASQAIVGMEKSIETMAYYIVLMFFAAQFVNYFGWSNIGVVTAIGGASWLGSFDLHPTILLVGIILLSAMINLFVGSASAKWALLAPVFVPMLMLLNIPPEQTQVAYRIGDSATNIITPLMPYFGIVLAYAQRYHSHLGLGHIISMMLPYSITLLFVWSLMIATWIGFGIPLGP